jgi:hypothetical protein
MKIARTESSFSEEKEAKRLSSICSAGSVPAEKSFLVLFFKKEHAWSAP